MPRCTTCDAYVMERAPTCGRCGSVMAVPKPARQRMLDSLGQTTEGREASRWVPPSARQVEPLSDFNGLRPVSTKNRSDARPLSLTQEQVHLAIAAGSCIVCGPPPGARWSQDPNRACDVCGLRTCHTCQTSTTREEGTLLLDKRS